MSGPPDKTFARELPPGATIEDVASALDDAAKQDYFGQFQVLQLDTGRIWVFQSGYLKKP